MAWYPGATKMELQPESDTQPAIRPTQFIVHSVVAPWDETRIYAYWRGSTLESHFGLDYDGSIGQYIGTETRADANAAANRRPDGTGAVSIETASNTKASDPWTPEQVEQLIRLGVWLHQQHEIPLQICRTASDPGFGYHSLHRDWSTSGTACPGPARIAQFKTTVFPGIVTRATGGDDLMAIDKAEFRAALLDALGNTPVKQALCRAAWLTDGVTGVPSEWTSATNPEWQPWSAIVTDGNKLRSIETAVGALTEAGLTEAQIQAIADKVAAAPQLADTIASKVADLLAARLTE